MRKTLVLAVLVYGCGHANNNNGDDVDLFDPSSLEDMAPDDTTTDDAGSISLINFGDAGCATTSAAATRLPVDLVFIFDRSQSMNTNNKWPPCVQALNAFFADSKSQGLNASLEFFCGSGEGSGTKAQKCEAAAVDYSMPTVTLTTLPNATVFSNAISAQTFCSGTPISAALDGSLRYAKTLIPSGHKGVVVLVTDGAPTSCETDIPTIAAMAAAQAGSVPTYVIGVGTNLKNLNAIAVGGGTGSAILVDISSPAATLANFGAALDKIRGSAVSCNFAMPAPPPGQSLDPAAVNMLLTQNGAQNAIGYDPGCQKGGGWEYDDPVNPQQIRLCTDACDAVKADPSAKIDIVFGCKTQQIP